MEAASEKGLAGKLREAGISESYASLLARGERNPSKPLAIHIFRETGVKLGAIANASDDDIDALERLVGRGKVIRGRVAE